MISVVRWNSLPISSTEMPRQPIQRERKCFNLLPELLILVNFTFHYYKLHVTLGISGLKGRFPPFGPPFPFLSFFMLIFSLFLSICRPVTSDKTLTAWIPLDPVPDNMGPLEFVAGSHTADLGRSVGIGVESDAAVGAAVEAGGYQLIGGAFKQGEVSFHAGWTFHRAPQNTTDVTRKVYTVIYIGKINKSMELSVF